MDIGMLHTHITVVTVFLCFFFLKTILLAMCKTTWLRKIRDKTKVVDVLLGLLIVVTGGYLAWVKGTVANYLLIKLILVLVTIPLGIMAMRKENKALAIVTLCIFIYIYGLAETKSLKFSNDRIVLPSDAPVAGDILESNVAKQLLYGKTLYQTLCVECHGEDGNKGLYKAPNPFISEYTYEEKEAIILHGKGLMKGYSKALAEADVVALLTYLSNKQEKRSKL